jgi:hypothetical protein
VTAQEAIIAVLTERERQKTMWSISHDREHTYEDWVELLEHYAERLSQGLDPEKTIAQIGALALAALESL